MAPGQTPAQAAGCAEVQASGTRELEPVPLEAGRGPLVCDDGVVGLRRVHRVEDRLLGEGRASGVGLRERFPGRQRWPPGTRDGVGEPLNGFRGVADEDMPERCPGSLIRVRGDRPQFGARWQEVAVDELVVPENGRAEGNDEVMPLEVTGDSGDAPGKDAPEAGVPGGERATGGAGCHQHRQRQFLGQAHRAVPPGRGVDARPRPP